jgi:CTP synthase (UTP-ammonia lyase)
MQHSLSIGLVGDFNESVLAHQAIPRALEQSGRRLGVSVSFAWVPTPEITSVSRISGFHGIWCVPASPYRSMDGALRAIRHARETGTPFLGTCGGFQHVVVEYGRNVLHWTDADHAETSPDAIRVVISPLKCALVEATGSVRFSPGSKIAKAYRSEQTMEGYHCRYGLNPDFHAELLGGPLRVSARDEAGEVRAVELADHPFFVATLFQPERAALKDEPAPLVEAFVKASAEGKVVLQPAGC